MYRPGERARFIGGHCGGKPETYSRRRSDTDGVITGVHVLQCSRAAPADRAFLRDVLGWAYVEDEASEPGWLMPSGAVIGLYEPRNPSPLPTP
jgi:hypothetical protein